MIKIYQKIRQNLLIENKTICHSALDAESIFNEILNQVQDDSIPSIGLNSLQIKLEFNPNNF